MSTVSICYEVAGGSHYNIAAMPTGPIVVVWTAGLGILGFALLAVILWTIAPTPRSPTKNEGYYVDAATGSRAPFPSLSDDLHDEKPSISLSVVIPAYNEIERLPKMLEETFEYLDQRVDRDRRFAYEIIVVDDGSSDGTSSVALEIGRNRAKAMKSPELAKKELRVLTLEKNRGKGGAVTQVDINLAMAYFAISLPLNHICLTWQGMMVSRGEKLLFADADGATKFSDIEKLEKEMDRVAAGPLGVAIGSRAHMVNTDAVVKVLLPVLRPRGQETG